MSPVCFKIFGRPIYWYGIMAALGFLAAMTNWSFLAKREKRTVDYGSDLAFWVLLAGILGARAAYILANLGHFWKHPLAIIRVDQGGLIFYGGFVAGILAVILYAIVRKERIWWMADFTITSVPLGHAIGRIGCFMNGCCYGIPTDGWLRVNVAGVWRQPTPLYSTLLNLLLYGLLLWVFCRKRGEPVRHGLVTGLYFILYPTCRFLLEFLRGDPRMTLGPLNVAQWISVVLFCAGWAILYFVYVRGASVAPSRKA